MIKNKSQKLRFAIVGSASTAIDFGLLFLLHTLGMTSIGANFISTTAAFLFSFNANRKFTFNAAGGNTKRQIILFIIVTFIGLWGIQPVIIHFSEPIIASFGYNDSIQLLFSKLLATMVSLVWNYVLYSRVVFKTPNEQHTS